MNYCCQNNMQNAEKESECSYSPLVSNEVIIGKNAETPGISRSAETTCLEPNCSFQCKRIPELRKHLEFIHKIAQPLTSLKFNSFEDFENWLSETERKHCCSYMRRRGWQKNKNSRSTAYYCNRGGAYTSNASRKQSKLQGSCKIGVECTSSMNVKVALVTKYQDQPTVEVDAYLQHYGHNIELSHIRINEKVKQNIASKLSKGISRHKIMDEIRESFEGFSAVNRQHLISLQDIYNIEKRNGIIASRGRYSTDSGITAQTWIQAMQKSEDNPVLLIKYQQETPQLEESFLSEDDFLLILQTPLQVKMLQKYGPSQHICIDFTQGKAADSSEFYLITIEVLIDSQNVCKQPQPIAWCVSNRRDEKIVSTFFTKIMRNMKGLKLTPSYVMVPFSAWHKIWVSVFGAGPRKLICSWHVQDSWMTQYAKLCPSSHSNTAEKSRVIRNLETVISEKNVDRFVSLLSECCADLKNNESTGNFGDYFALNYANCTEEWASAYRSDDANQSDIAFKLFNERLTKHIYHEGLKRKQLDVLIKTLMKYSRDKVLTKLRMTFLAENEQQSRSMTQSVHNHSLALSTKWVVESQESESTWFVMEPCPSPGDIKKTVAQYTVQFSKMFSCRARLRCPLRCLECTICSHCVTCSCTRQKASICHEQEIMCRHVHLVCTYLQKHCPHYMKTILKAYERDIKENSISEIVPEPQQMTILHAIPPPDVCSIVVGDEVIIEEDSDSTNEQKTVTVVIDS